MVSSVNTLQFEFLVLRVLIFIYMVFCGRYFRTFFSKGIYLDYDGNMWTIISTYGASSYLFNLYLNYINFYIKF